MGKGVGRGRGLTGRKEGPGPVLELRGRRQRPLSMPFLQAAMLPVDAFRKCFL